MVQLSKHFAAFSIYESQPCEKGIRLAFSLVWQRRFNICGTVKQVFSLVFHVYRQYLRDLNGI